ncbi:hypothetical protein QFZ99_003880 [Paraburkholderia atlantica]|uniref:hypothetical protein n=1 Tax=Paraburkholderia atlantica TaxID=2654982 RepID=UPI003D216C1C
MGRTCELILYAANMHGPRFHRRPALFHRIGALRQDVIDHANRVGRNVTVSPSPLHDGVHALAVAASLAAELRKHTGIKRADPLRGVLPLLPAGFESAMTFPRRLLEGERGGSNTGGLLLAE